MQILNRWTEQVIASGDTIRSAAEQAKADLSGANLSGANLSGADLYRADLRGADLRWADLSGANLYRADLSGANLSGANLSGADLYRADLRGAKLNWQSHDLLAEILRQSAGGDIEKRKIAGLILVSRDWCWEQFLAANDPLTAWALDVLRPCVKDNESAPDVLRGEKV